MKNVQRKFLKKAGIHIRAIQSAGCMNEVITRMNDAHLDVFGLRNLGLIKIRMLRENRLSDFDATKSYRRIDAIRFGYSLKVFLFKYIPERMRTSRMYADLLNQL